MDKQTDIGTLSADDLERGGAADANRPSSSDIPGITIVAPDADTGSSADAGTGDDGNSGTKRGRGKPQGTGSTSKTRASTAKQKAVNVEGIESILYAVHLGITKIASMPSFALDKEEAT